jgi:hypothetical protein
MGEHERQVTVVIRLKEGRGFPRKAAFQHVYAQAMMEGTVSFVQRPPFERAPRPRLRSFGRPGRPSLDLSQERTIRCGMGSVGCLRGP